MVSFSCENCGDVFTKKKLDSHRNQCRGATYTCLDCMTHFPGVEYRSHTSCISEAQKYQGKLYNDKKAPKSAHQQSGSRSNASDKNKPDASSTSESQSQALVPRAAYVEEVRETTAVAIVDAPPHAPSPPPALNVFDFLIGDGTTVREEDSDAAEDEESEWDSDSDDEEDQDTPMSDDADEPYVVNDYSFDPPPVPQYTSVSQPNGEVVTPAPQKGHSRNISLDSTGQKKSQKRKRAHLEELDLSKSNDVVMTDVPTIHSGLTGGMSRLIGRPDFPPSPDLSGDAVGESPLSPLKRNRRKDEAEHRREKKARRKSNSDNEEKKAKRAKDEVKVDRNGAGRWERRRPRKRSVSPSAGKSASSGAVRGKQLKSIQYPTSGNPQSQALVKYGEATMELEKPLPVSKNIDLFLGSLIKGSETEQGVTVHKALKRWQKAGGSGEKELWKGIKVRANERGELVICI